MKTIDSFKRWCKRQPRKKLIRIFAIMIINLIIVVYGLYIELQTT